MEKKDISFEDRKRLIQRSIICVFLFFCAAIVSLNTFVWLKGARLEPLIVSGTFMLALNFFLCGLSYLLTIRKAREYVDNGITFEPQSFRSNYSQPLLLCTSLVLDIIGLIMIFAKNMLLIGVLFVVIGGVLIIIWSKLLLQKKPSSVSTNNGVM